MNNFSHYFEAWNTQEPVRLTKEPTINPTATLQKCNLGDYVQIGVYNNISESSIDDFSYTSEYCQIIYSTIGKFCNIASLVRINPGQHPMHKATQHHMLYRKSMFGFGEDDEEFFDWRKKKQVQIGHDTWIGHGAVIMGGVNVANGSVIGAGAIVTKDIPAYAVAVGNPARIIKYRFDEKTIRDLEEIKWWDWEYQKIKKSLEDFNNINRFIEKYAH